MNIGREDATDSANTLRSYMACAPVPADCLNSAGGLNLLVEHYHGNFFSSQYLHKLKSSEICNLRVPLG